MWYHVVIICISNNFNMKNTFDHITITAQVLVFYTHIYYTFCVLVPETVLLVNSMNLELGLGESITPTLSHNPMLSLSRSTSVQC